MSHAQGQRKTRLPDLLSDLFCWVLFGPTFPSVRNSHIFNVCPDQFFLVRTSIPDLFADGKSLLRTSGVGGGGSNSDLHQRFIGIPIGPPTQVNV